MKLTAARRMRYNTLFQREGYSSSPQWEVISRDFSQMNTEFSLKKVIKKSFIECAKSSQLGPVFPDELESPQGKL